MTIEDDAPDGNIFVQGETRVTVTATASDGTTQAMCTFTVSVTGEHDILLKSLCYTV